MSALKADEWLALVTHRGALPWPSSWYGCAGLATARCWLPGQRAASKAVAYSLVRAPPGPWGRGTRRYPARLPGQRWRLGGPLGSTHRLSFAEMALRTMRLDINAPALHEMFNGRWVNPCEEDVEAVVTSWNVAIPLVWRDQTVGRLEVSGKRDEQPVWVKIATLTKLVDDLELALSKIADDVGLPTPARPIGGAAATPLTSPCWIST